MSEFIGKRRRLGAPRTAKASVGQPPAKFVLLRNQVQIVIESEDLEHSGEYGEAHRQVA